MQKKFSISTISWRPQVSTPAGHRTRAGNLVNDGRIRALILVSLFTVMSLVLACSGDDDITAVRGRSIEVHATTPFVVDKISFTSGNENRVIRPRASNRQLAVVQVTVVNRTSTVMPLLVNPEAAQLGDRRGERIDALDPFMSSAETTNLDEDHDRYVPLLWGDVELDRNFQVEGWMYFDVPKGLSLKTLWWDEVDQVVADFAEYKPITQ